jgi:hypothetical protein
VRPLVSLWDIMKKFDPLNFFWIGMSLEKSEHDKDSAAHSIGGGVPPELVAAQTKVYSIEQAFLHLASELGGELTEDLELKSFKKVSVYIRQKLKEEGTKLTPEEFEALRGECRRHFVWDAEDRLYMYVPADKVPLYENSMLTAPAREAFPTAHSELKAAGSCYAAECNTAAVFHAMRAAEKGLHAHAEALGVTFPYPIELADWQNVIEGIDAKIVSMKALAKGQPKSDELTFHSKAAVQYWYFKEAWRNHVAHSRDVYSDHQARTIITHVTDFIEQLATRIKEPE